MRVFDANSRYDICLRLLQRMGKLPLRVAPFDGSTALSKNAICRERPEEIPAVVAVLE